MTDTVGQKLQNARQARSLTLEQAANSTHIRLHYLKALEEGNITILPSPAQARGFLRAYAGYLGLDAADLLEELKNEYPALSSASPTLPVKTSPRAEITTEQADVIFKEVGERLRQHRELLGLSLDDIERHTHLRTHYLQALESGNLRSLPSPVQGRGMLNNYAAFLGLDPEPLLLRFAEGLQARLIAQQASRSEPKPARTAPPKAQASPLRRFLSIEFLIAGGVVVFLVGFVLWGSLRVSAMRSQALKGTATPTSPSIADVLLQPASLTPSPSPIVGMATSTQPFPGFLTGPTEIESIPGSTLETTIPGQVITGTVATAALPGQGDAPIQVYVIVRQRAWMHVLVDGKEEFMGRVQPGSAYTFQGKGRVELLTGNGAALQVYFNQTDLGTMGILGEVIQRVFTLEGVQTPTATLTFTPLPSPQTTPTPPGTTTPAPTSSPTRMP